MAADVHERAYAIVAPPHDDDRFPRDIEPEPVSRLGNATLVAHAQPMAEVDALDVPREDLGIGVELLEQSRALGLALQQ
jgi:hypothetical protein